MCRIHYMKLNDYPFEKIEKGEKLVELRLYDDKRSRLRVNDYIVFSIRSNPSEKVAVHVVALFIFPTFYELFQEIPLNVCGFEYDVTPEKALERLYDIYEGKDEERYGVVGIKFALADLCKVEEIETKLTEADVERYFPDGMK